MISPQNNSKDSSSSAAIRKAQKAFAYAADEMNIATEDDVQSLINELRLAESSDLHSDSNS